MNRLLIRRSVPALMGCLFGQRPVWCRRVIARVHARMAHERVPVVNCQRTVMLGWRTKRWQPCGRYTLQLLAAARRAVRSVPVMSVRRVM